MEDNNLNELSITDQLISAIKELSEDRKRHLLGVIQKSDWNTKNKREHIRKKLVPDSYSHQVSEKELIIKNLSIGGAFIETEKNLPPNHKISLDLSFSDKKKTLIIDGEVIRTTPDGVGIKFLINDEKVLDQLKKALSNYHGN